MITLNLSVNELVFLAALVDADSIVGIENPFTTGLPVEVEEAWAQAKISLAEKQYIKIDDNDSLVIDTIVANVIAACCYPNNFIVLTKHGFEKKLSGFYLYVSNMLAVQMTVDETKTCALTVLPHVDAVLNCVYSHIELSDKYEPEDTVNIELPVTAWTSLSTHIKDNKPDQAVASLVSYGLNKDLANKLAQILINDLVYCSIVNMEYLNTASPTVQTLGIYKNSDGYWLLHSTETEVNIYYGQKSTANIIVKAILLSISQTLLFENDSTIANWSELLV